MTEQIFSQSKLKLASVKKLEIPTIEEDAERALYVYLCSADLTYKIVTQKEYSKMIREFYKQMTHYLMTTRFNNCTFKENRSFCKKNPNIGCIYGSPVEIRSSIPIERVLFILEMNNDTNSIEAIGMVRNKPYFKKYNVYTNMNYNRFFYIGKYRIDKNEMNEQEKKIMKLLESFCFKGVQHMKRGHGITGYATEILFRLYPFIDVIEFIKEMFKERIDEEKNKLIQ